MSDLLDIEVFGKAYRVACEPGERESLAKAVGLVEDRAASIRGKTRTSAERLAAMVALELAHEIVQAQAGDAGVAAAALQRRIAAIEARIAVALDQEDTLI